MWNHKLHQELGPYPKYLGPTRTSLPNFQFHITSGQVEQPIATTYVELDIGDNTFSEPFVVMKILTSPF